MSFKELNQIKATYCMCLWVGEITISDAGQTKVNAT